MECTTRKSEICNEKTSILQPPLKGVGMIRSISEDIFGNKE